MRQQVILQSINQFNQQLIAVLNTGEDLPIQGLQAEQVWGIFSTELGILLRVGNHEGYFFLRDLYAGNDALQKLMIEDKQLYVVEQSGERRTAGFYYDILNREYKFDQFEEVYIKESSVRITLTDGTDFKIGEMRPEEKDIISTYLINHKYELIIVFRNGQVQNIGKLRLPLGAGKTIHTIFQSYEGTLPIAAYLKAYMSVLGEMNSHKLTRVDKVGDWVMLSYVDRTVKLRINHPFVHQLYVIDDQIMMDTTMDASLVIGTISQSNDQNIKQLYLSHAQSLLIIYEDYRVVELG
ncbi:hypothetical protein [Dolosigranulum savutiense]|uniref:DUF4905 domain-containing protein n=1 Tax=Dolosigranulum savutiense TaxID=3110288 RepID=A0AB74TSE0_9LACT